MTALLAWIRDLTDADEARRGERLQTLWGGYGELVRVHLEGAAVPSVVVKQVTPPAAPSHHPRGWATARSHARKLRSYQVEQAWYEGYAARCGPGCRVPSYLGGRRRERGWEFALEDLDAAGYPGRRRAAPPAEVDRCLTWLAALHATFLGEAPEGLWESGTYWHLATRPDELEALEDEELRAAAPALDARLEGARFLTLVHGDAKLANFCFAPDGSAVAAVDFQYAGRGCGMKDVAYLLSCASSEVELASTAEPHLDHYFRALAAALEGRLDPTERVALEDEWRALYSFAWADLSRFLGGWSPGHWKLHGYARRRSEEALRALEGPARA